MDLQSASIGLHDLRSLKAMEALGSEDISIDVTYTYVGVSNIHNRSIELYHSMNPRSLQAVESYEFARLLGGSGGAGGLRQRAEKRFEAVCPGLSKALG